MAVDYQARKAAKKGRRRAEELKPRRERKKKQPRRLCRGPCYQEPGLTADDLSEEGGRAARRGSAAAGELAKFAHLDFGNDGGSGGGSAAKRSSSKADDKPGAAGAKRKPQKQAAGGADAPAGDASDPASSAPAGKKPKLSTAVNLLDARTARTEAPRQKQLPPAAVSEELCQFPDLLQRFMAGEGFAEPMPIQSRCWPVLLAGRDVEALAEPGSGKTLAYLLPAAQLLAKKGHGVGTTPDTPLALILLPTRELAQQVASACRDLRKYCGLRTACITGGSDRGQQVEALSKQPHIVVATPGRLLDLVQDNTLQLGHVQYVVLDEADKMLGLGFQPQIQQLKALLLPSLEAAGEGSAAAGGKAGKGDGQKQKKARRVQVGLFTATMPESLEAVAADWLHHPEHIRVSPSAASISKSVTQVVQVCAEHKKPAKLAKHLQQIQEAAKGMRNPPRILIFANRIKTVRFLHRQVTEAGYRAALLHGERSQEEREAAMADFRSGKAQVLVASDVAARGLHIRGLPYVVNYDFPPNLEQYIHRVGRTGRLATDGHAFSFFTREMARLAPPVVELLQQHNQALDPNLVKLAEAYRIAAEKLGLVAEATGEEAGEPQREDVLRGLGMKTAAQKKKERQQQRQQQRRQERQQQRGGSGSDSDSEGGEGEGQGGSSSNEESEGEGAAHRRPQQGDQQPSAAAAAAATQQQQQQGVPPDETEEPEYFVASKKFTGARPGYAFKKGRLGLGYYLDPVQQKQQQATAAQAGSGKRVKGAAAAAKQQHKAELQQLKQKYSHAPIGGRGEDGSKPAASAKARRQQEQQRQQKQQQAAAAATASAAAAAAKPAAAAAAPAVPLLPGRLKELKRQRQQAAAAGQLSGFSDSEDEGPPPAAAAPTSKRPKALPGRLRKKLAKQRAAKD